MSPVLNMPPKPSGGLLSEVPQAGPRRLVDYFQQFGYEFAVGLACLVLTQVFALTVPRLLNWATDAILTHNVQSAIDAAWWMVGAAILAAVTRVISRVLIFSAGRRVEFALRQDLFRHILLQGQDFYHNMPQGQVMSRMVSDLTQVRLLLGVGILNLTNTILVYAVVLPILFYTDWLLTVSALSTLPLFLFAGRVFSRRIYPLGAEAQERLGKMSARVQENLSGVMTVRAYGQEVQEEERFKELTDDYLSVSINLARIQGFLFPAMGLVAGLGSVIVIGLSGMRIQSGAMTVGGFVEFNAYFGALTWPTIALGWIISLLQRSKAAMERVNDIFRAEPSLHYNGTAPTASYSHGSQRVSPPRDEAVPTTVSQTTHQHDVHWEIRNLTFCHSEDSPPALQDINLTIRRGELVVVTGRTGSGKSTLLEVITRLLSVPEGVVFFDGRDVTTMPVSVVRSRVAYAPQDAFLFSRSLEENVRFGQPSAPLEKVNLALTKASFDVNEDVFPEGVRTVIGERGVTLSGGQRQRTTLARALLPERDILVLDDTLSAVDSETETRILNTLLGSRSSSDGFRQQTVVMATHRLACAQYADRVLVLEQGRLVEQGTESELIARGGIYADMHRRQRIRDSMAQSSSEGVLEGSQA
ncbi:MAG: ABC transporter ATP-binding protein/permease [Myxococcales bacterium]|nr:ABC transporter ATP-binding protein/permease [Myxococcales bacterium]